MKSAKIECVVCTYNAASAPFAMDRQRVPVTRGDILQFRRRLLHWYDRHKRDLPWRQERDAYRVWLSEIMLQQTRVAAVLEHYREFVKRFPSVQRLARARESSVYTADNFLTPPQSCASFPASDLTLRRRLPAFASASGSRLWTEMSNAFSDVSWVEICHAPRRGNSHRDSLTQTAPVISTKP